MEHILLIILLTSAAFCAWQMAAHDMRRRIIPDIYLWPFLLIGLIVTTMFPWITAPAESVITAAFGYALATGVGWIFQKLEERRAQSADVNSCKLKAKETNNSKLQTSSLSALRSHNYGAPIGMGDIKLITAGGIWLGATGLAAALVVSCIAGYIWGVRNRQRHIPFAPFFFIGMIVALPVLFLL